LSDTPELYVFGFSRGAAEARLFVHETRRPVEFLGLFETVPGNRSKLKARMTVPREVKQVFHVLSMDERRFEFHPLPITFGTIVVNYYSFHYFFSIIILFIYLFSLCIYSFSCS
jgi:uncharacterized protein (DUF2235 family)